MSAKTLRQFPRDRHGLRITPEGVKPFRNPDLEVRWERKYRFFQFIKAQTESKRQELVRAFYRIDRLETVPQEDRA